MNHSEEAFEKILVSNLQRAIDFLKFAEAKNGALLTFTSAWTLATIGIVSNSGSLPACVLTGLKVTLPLMISAGGFALASFIPRTNLPRFLGGPRAGPHPKNFLYFGDIASMTASEFERAIRERYLPKDGHATTDDYIHDLSIQVFVNSQITHRKLRLFLCGILAAAAAVLLLVVTVFTLALGFWQGG